MRRWREEDHASRKRLLRYFSDLTVILADMDDRMLHHVDRQGQVRRDIDNFKHDLDDPPNKLVVAG